MGKSQPKRRTGTAKQHQVAKSASAKKKKNVNWTRIILIIIGVMIVVSMILSMLIVPGASVGF